MLIQPEVAEIAYHSSITEQEEKLPFALAMMGNPGKTLCEPLKTFKADRTSRNRSRTDGRSPNNFEEGGLTDRC